MNSVDLLLLWFLIIYINNVFWYHVVRVWGQQFGALFNFQSFLTVVLLTICTCTYIHERTPALLDRNKQGYSKSPSPPSLTNRPANFQSTESVLAVWNEHINQTGFVWIPHNMHMQKHVLDLSSKIHLSSLFLFCLRQHPGIVLEGSTCRWVPLMINIQLFFFFLSLLSFSLPPHDAILTHHCHGTVFRRAFEPICVSIHDRHEPLRPLRSLKQTSKQAKCKADKASVEYKNTKNTFKQNFCYSGMIGM